MPDPLHDAAERTLTAVRDNLLRPMHDSVSQRIDAVARLVRIAVWLGIINIIVLIAAVVYACCIIHS